MRWDLRLLITLSVERACHGLKTIQTMVRGCPAQIFPMQHLNQLKAACSDLHCVLGLVMALLKQQEIASGVRCDESALNDPFLRTTMALLEGKHRVLACAVHDES